MPRDIERVEAFTEAGAAEKLRASTESISDLSPPLGHCPDNLPQRKTLLCVGMAQDNGRVVLRDGCLELSQCSFIVPNPMTTYAGHNQDGELSCRTLENTGPRRFLPLDFDFSRYDRSGLNKTIWYEPLSAWRRVDVRRRTCVQRNRRVVVMRDSATSAAHNGSEHRRQVSPPLVLRQRA